MKESGIATLEKTRRDADDLIRCVLKQVPEDTKMEIALIIEGFVLHAESCKDRFVNENRKE